MPNKNESHLNILEQNASIFWREINPKASSCIQLKRLLEMYATFENWESVINLASRAVLHLNKNYERAEFYHIWICALNETHDLTSLVHLAKHLLLMGEEYSVFNCLAIIAYTFAGKNKIALKLLKEQKKSCNVKNRHYREAVGLFLSSLKNKRYIKKGIYILRKLCSDKNVGYLSWRNCLRVLSQYNCVISMSRMYNLMHVRFPFAHEPYITSSLIAIDEKNWAESIRLLNQIIKDNPHNMEAILALSQSYEENNEHEKAYHLVVKNKDLFHEQDYDYNYTMARLLEKSAKSKQSKEDCEDAILFYDRVISLARFFRFPVEKLEHSRNEMHKLNRIFENKSNLLSSLETFLQKNSSPSIVSSLAIAGAGRAFKLYSK